MVISSVSWTVPKNQAATVIIHLQPFELIEDCLQVAILNTFLALHSSFKDCPSMESLNKLLVRRLQYDSHCMGIDPRTFLRVLTPAATRFANC